MVDLQRGDLAAARQELRLPGAVADPTATVAYIAQYYDLGWTLDSANDRLLMTMGPESFDGDSASWAIVIAQQHYFHGNEPAARTAAAVALRALDTQLKSTPADDQRLLLRGLALAYLGRYPEAIESESAASPSGTQRRTGSTAPTTRTCSHAFSSWQGSRTRHSTFSRSIGKAVLSHAGVAQDRSELQAAAWECAV